MQAAADVDRSCMKSSPPQDDPADDRVLQGQAPTKRLVTAHSTPSASCSRMHALSLARRASIQRWMVSRVSSASVSDDLMHFKRSKVGVGAVEGPSSWQVSAEAYLALTWSRSGECQSESTATRGAPACLALRAVSSYTQRPLKHTRRLLLC